MSMLIPATLPIARQREDGSAQELIDHLQGVADLASEFCSALQSANFGRIAGMWHDLGKYRPGFQRYIRECVDAHCETSVTGRDKTHSGAGALYAMDVFAAQPMLGRVFAWLIASHHSGLHDWEALAARMAQPETRCELMEAMQTAPAPLFQYADLPLDLRQVGGGKAGFHLWLRLLFSSLVDADFLDTERFMDQGKHAARYTFPALAVLHQRFDLHMAGLAVKAKPGLINTLRADVLGQCRTKAALDQRVFTLTVPTGGGKTLSSMAFALEHAKCFGRKRIIYAIPFTSIIEQTADVFRQVFGEDSFIEHHSNAEADQDKEEHRTRLACENWDAPLVLTTNVQLFESLFAAKTSRCRKLHNLVDSVIVLDEAQLLPPQFLQPIIDVLQLLTRHYRVTLVLCTATQPALNRRESTDPKRGFHGFDSTEIIDEPDRLYQQLQRVKVEIPANLHEKRSWEDIARDIAQEDCVLAIVNTRTSARELCQRLPGGSIYLSTRLCGQHRSDLLAWIRTRLQGRADGSDLRPLRVVSTQLIEAGVDVDFPVVYRALAGLDSIAQAAGRCNREGRLPQPGRVHVFVPPLDPPRGLLTKARDSCINTWGGHHGDPLALSLYQRYFQDLYGVCDRDQHGITPLLQATCGQNLIAPQFRTVASRFKLIDDDDSVSVLVRYRGVDGCDERIDQLLAMLQSEGPQRWLMRKLQRYGVNLRQAELARLCQQGDVREWLPGIFVQAGDVLYDPVWGVNVDATPINPASLVM